jgi:hypothetical protein
MRTRGALQQSNHVHTEWGQSQSTGAITHSLHRVLAALSVFAMLVVLLPARNWLFLFSGYYICWHHLAVAASWHVWVLYLAAAAAAAAAATAKPLLLAAAVAGWHRQAAAVCFFAASW